MIRLRVPAIALAATAAAFCARGNASPPAPRLTWIATAHQFGPVSYRDPAGALSPDGRWIAYSEGRLLRVRPAAGGAVTEFPAGEAQIRNLAWSPDSRTILADGYATPAGWALYDRVDVTRRPLWPDRETLTASEAMTARVTDLRQPAWSPDGRSIAAVVNGREGQELWTIAADGQSAHAERVRRRIAFPAWTPRGQLACIATIDGRQRVTLPCGESPLTSQPDLDAYGPLAFSPDGGLAYVSLANSAGTVDLWVVPTSGGRARQLTFFSRDSYAPSVAADGSLLLKVQSYRTFVSVTSASGGPSRPLATFQSETPSWDPSGKWIGITYGTWRRVPDDAKYPDIAQDAGIIAADPVHPAESPAKVVHDSASEDQSLCWSPNGKWIAFHTHKDQSDDIWLRQADGAPDARRISFLGRGAEAGWPRWSPDGRRLLFTGASRATRRTVVYVAGVDQDSGAVTEAAREVELRGMTIDVFHAEWLPDSTRFAVVGKEGPGRHVILTAAIDATAPRIVHRFASEHDAPGLGVSPDGRDAAFIAPAADGFFQVFRLPLAGGAPIQVTADPSNKTQPAWSPEGARIAFTVWNYDAHFYRIEAGGSRP